MILSLRLRQIRARLGLFKQEFERSSLLTFPTCNRTFSDETFRGHSPQRRSETSLTAAFRSSAERERQKSLNEGRNDFENNETFSKKAIRDVRTVYRWQQDAKDAAENDMLAMRIPFDRVCAIKKSAIALSPRK